MAKQPANQANGSLAIDPLVRMATIMRARLKILEISFNAAILKKKKCSGLMKLGVDYISGTAQEV